MDHYTKKFSNILLDPMEWLKTAERLLEAAKLFEPKIDAYWTELAKWARKEQADPIRFEHYVAIYFMLCSYVLDNIFKAVIIQDNKVTLETEIKNKAKFPAILKLGFYHLSRFRCSDLGCWVYYENPLPSPPRSEYRPSVPCGGSRA
jgi:hypothetical protein